MEELEDYLGYYQLKGTKLKLRTYQASAKKNIDKCLSKHNFTCAILPTGSGKSFVALSEMLKFKDKEILYLSPNDEILNQIKGYIIEYIHGFKNVLIKDENEIIKEIFPNLKLCTYSSLLSFNQKEIINRKYDLIIFDELHRTGAKEWKKQVLELVKNQDNNTKILGITATPQRDMDLMNMANEWAEYFGYTEEEIIKGNHLAVNMDLEDAVKLGYVLNPKVVECEYSSLNTSGLLDGLLEKIKYIEDEEKRNVLIKKHDVLRRKVNTAKGIEEVIGDNLKLGDKVIVFCPVLNKDGKVIENEPNDKAARSLDTINTYIKQLKEYLMTYYNKTEEEINSMVKFNSMLGEYGKAKNRRELELFEQDNKEKIKFMIVINKLNEGSHIKGVNKLIWFRPLDENSKILMQQQFGRIIKSKVPNKKVKEEDRPMAIDLVGNLVRVNLSKKEKEKASDLDKMKLAINWIDLNNRMPDVNSLDKVERSYGRSLKRIKDKYLNYTSNNNLLDNLNKKHKIETLEILRLGNDIDLWNYNFVEIIKENKENDDKEFDNNFDLFELNGILKDFVELNEEINSYMLSYEQKLVEYIKMINGTYEPRTCDLETIFSDGTIVNTFWDRNRDKIEDELNTKPIYKEGYEIAKEKVKRLQEKRNVRRNALPFDKKIEEYIEMINNGYYPKRQELELCFSNGDKINHFWDNNKDLIFDILENNIDYSKGYENALSIVKERIELAKLKKQRMKNIKKYIDEYIEKINDGYIPKVYDPIESFSDGIFINSFWKNHRNKIIKEFFKNSKYNKGYDKVQSFINQEILKQNIDKLSYEEKLIEYIEKLNKGYIPKYEDFKENFSNGASVNTFWATNKERIKQELENNIKYQVGYDIAKRIVLEKNIDKISIFIDEFVDKINSGYIPKNFDSLELFSDGTKVNYFWDLHKEKVINEVLNNLKYDVGYEKARFYIKNYVKKANNKLSVNERIIEFIEKLNDGYIPTWYDTVETFSNGEFVHGFWNIHHDKIINELIENPKYKKGYKKALLAVKNEMKRVEDKLSINQKIDEFIEKLNDGYIPKTFDSIEKFSNGEKVGYFWKYKERIRKELKENPKYEKGYDDVFNFVNKNLSFKQKMSEFIDKLNQGYIPKDKEIEESFSNGNPINFFWSYNKYTIKDELDNNIKYQVGYEKAKNIVEIKFMQLQKRGKSKRLN